MQIGSVMRFILLLVFASLSFGMAHAQPDEGLMKSSGFKVQIAEIGQLIFVPNGAGSYDITTRFDGDIVKGRDCEFMEHPTGRYPAFTLCRIEDWKAPIGFIEDLSSGDMNFEGLLSGVNEFDSNKSQSNHLRTTPVVGVIYYSDFSQRVHEVEAKVWAICWDKSLEGYGPSIMSQTPKRIDCKKEKVNLAGLLLDNSIEHEKKVGKALDEILEGLEKPKSDVK